MAEPKKQAKPVKKVKNAILFDDGTIQVFLVRGSYLHIAKKWAKNPEKETPRFSGTFLMGKETHVEAKNLIKAECDKLIASKQWKKLAADKKFMRDGDLGDKPEHEGFFTLATGETRPPIVLDRSAEPLDVEEIERICKSGHWYDIIIRPWIQDNEHGKRINAGLSFVQHRKKDEEFGQGTLSEDDARSRASKYDDDDDDSSGYDEDDDGSEGL